MVLAYVGDDVFCCLFGSNERLDAKHIYFIAKQSGFIKYF